MQDPDTLILEIFRQEQALKMSLFEQKEQASTLRHYSVREVDFAEINSLSQEAASILNKIDRKGRFSPDSLNNLKKTGQLLWEHLLTRQVKERLKSTRDKILSLSIDEELIDIPWELLYDGSEFLCLKFGLGRLIRTAYEAAAVHYRGFSSIAKMLILANPTNDLNSAYLEGLNIKNQFDKKRSKIQINFKSIYSDRMYVKKNICDYDIVHFAGHCEYSPQDTRNTGWVLCDGKFSAQDVLSLGVSAPLPSLVFSNACHSAEEPGEFIEPDYHKNSFSLAKAFLLAGVRHFIGAVRKIEDSASFSFAREFYSHLLQGKSVGECMRLSRQSLIQEHGINTIFWTSYLLYGDPNFVLFSPPVAKKIKQTKIPLKKFSLFALSTIPVLVFSTYLFLKLPSLNPSTHFLYNRSKKMFLSGNNPQAISLVKDIIEKEPSFLAAYPLIGDTYRRMGKPDEALKYYFDYVLQSEKKKDRRHQASAYIGIGWIYHLLGDYPKAFDFYNKALDLSRENKDRLNEADVLGKIAIWYIDKDDNDKALELLTKSSEINRQRIRNRKHQYNLACDYFNLGLLFTNKDDYSTAKEFYEKSFALFDKLKLEYELSDYYFNVGEICIFQKEYQKAMDYYAKGLKIDEKLGHLPNIAADYNMIGELYMEMDNFEEARNYFHKAIEVCKEIKAPLELAWAYQYLGLLYKKEGFKNRAREYLRYAQEIYTKVDTADYEEVKKELLSLDRL